jgi:hypothetical protein
MASKNCKHPTCEGLCRRPVKEKKYYEIPRISKKRLAENKTYTPAVKAYVKANPYCAIKSEVCTKITDAPHHTKGRIGSLLSDERYWLPACNECNLYIEDNDAWARANGFKVSKFTPNLPPI